MIRFLFLLLPILLFGANTPPIIDLTINGATEPAQFVKTINIAILLTLLVLAPSLLLMMTSFLRLLIVFALLRQALGLQQSPPNQVLISLSLILTFFIMQPYAKKSWDEGIKPYIDKKIGYEIAFKKSIKPFEEFMIKNTREKDLALFYRIRNLPNPKNIEDVDFFALLPAFIVSEYLSVAVNFLLEIIKPLSDCCT